MSFFRRATLGLSIVLFLPGVWVRAQTGFTSIPDSIKTDDSAEKDRPAVRAFIEFQMKDLVGNDNPSAQTNARDSLVQEALLQGENKSSPSYLDVYADILNDSLMKLKDQPLRIRLNGAIVACRVAKVAANIRLAGAITQFIQDKSDAVCLWGVKSAQYVLIPLLSNPLTPNGSPVLPAIVPATQAHASGLITEAAYTSLAMDLESNSSSITNPMISMVVPQMQILLQWRIGRYLQSGLEKLAAENIATSFLTNTQVWNAQSYAQQDMAVQLLSDLIGVGAARAIQADKGGDTANKMEVIAMLNQTADAIEVVLQILNQSDLARQLDPVKQINSSTPAAIIQTRCAAVYTTLNSLPRFKNLRSPPAPAAKAAD